MFSKESSVIHGMFILSMLLGTSSAFAQTPASTSEILQSNLKVIDAEIAPYTADEEKLVATLSDKAKQLKELIRSTSEITSEANRIADILNQTTPDYFEDYFKLYTEYQKLSIKALMIKEEVSQSEKDLEQIQSSFAKSIVIKWRLEIFKILISENHHGKCIPAEFVLSADEIEKIKGMNVELLAARADACESNNDTFEYNEKKYSTRTGELQKKKKRSIFNKRK